MTVSSRVPPVAQAPTLKTLSIIGCGKVGTTLAHLWVSKSVFRLNQVLNRSFNSSLLAVNTIMQHAADQSTCAITQFDELQPSDIFLITTPDDLISETFLKLVDSGVLKSGNIVMHCSGALSSEVFTLTDKLNVQLGLASLHPIKSFISVEESVATFAGTYCGLEGSEAAATLLEEAIKSIGGMVLSLAFSAQLAHYKMLYHAAQVFTCNYLSVLVECSCRLLSEVGVEEQQALKILEPMMLETVHNIVNKGPKSALTGPISRGDSQLITQQLASLALFESTVDDACNVDQQLVISDAYKAMGRIACQMMTRKDESFVQQESIDLALR